MNKKVIRKIFNFHSLLASATIVWVVVLGVAYFRDNYTATELVVKVPKVEFLPLPDSTDHYKWKADSPYTIVSYFSLDCPHCRKLDEIEEKHKDSYDTAFTLVYRHSPLPSQPLSGQKALIAECVYEQSGDEGMFKYITDSYKNYRFITKNNDWTIDIAKKYVDDSQKLDTCIASDEMALRISRFKNKAISYNVLGTPTIGLFKDGVLMRRFDISGEIPVKAVMDYLVEQMAMASSTKK